MKPPLKFKSWLRPLEPTQMPEFSKQWSIIFKWFIKLEPFGFRALNDDWRSSMRRRASPSTNGERLSTSAGFQREHYDICCEINKSRSETERPRSEIKRRDKYMKQRYSLFKPSVCSHVSSVESVQWLLISWKHSLHPHSQFVSPPSHRRKRKEQIISSLIMIRINTGSKTSQKLISTLIQKTTATLVLSNTFMSVSL